MGRPGRRGLWGCRMRGGRYAFCPRPRFGKIEVDDADDWGRVEGSLGVHLARWKCTNAAWIIRFCGYLDMWAPMAKWDCAVSWHTSCTCTMTRPKKKKKPKSIITQHISYLGDLGKLAMYLTT